MVQVEDILSKIAEVLYGKLPVWDFYDWLNEVSWDLWRERAPEAFEVAGQAKLIFNDYDLRVIGRKELVSQLGRLLKPQACVLSADSELQVQALTYLNISTISAFDQMGQTARV